MARAGLVKKTITNKLGKRTSVWIRMSKEKGGLKELHRYIDSVEDKKGFKSKGKVFSIGEGVKIRIDAKYDTKERMPVYRVQVRDRGRAYNTGHHETSKAKYDAPDWEGHSNTRARLQKIAKNQKGLLKHLDTKKNKPDLHSVLDGIRDLKIKRSRYGNELGDVKHGLDIINKQAREHIDSKIIELKKTRDELNAEFLKRENK